MFSLLKKVVAAGVAVMTLSLALGFALSADSVQARPAYVKIPEIQGEVRNTATDDSKRAAPSRIHPQRRVTPGQLRRILRRAKPLSPAERLALKRTPPPPPGAPGSLSAGEKGGGGTIKGITCSLGLCFCSGASHCNVLIAACVEVGGTLNCTEHDKEGRPTGCSCFK